MKLALSLGAASIINLLLFWLMIQLVTSEQNKEWVRTTDAEFFDFIRHRTQPETIARQSRKTPPKPEPQPPETFSEPMPRQPVPTDNLRALPLPVPALKIDIPMNARLNVGAGPSLPAVVSGGHSKSGALGGAKGAGSGFSVPSFIMADELTAISRVQPMYPEQLRFRRIEGQVLVEFTVTKDGTVSDPVVIESKPSGSFDRAALRAVLKWRFQPRRDDQGNPVTVRARQFFAFTLN
ncbi:MAG: energy transducer TonB [Methylomicrobium sp.]